MALSSEVARLLSQQFEQHQVQKNLPCGGTRLRAGGATLDYPLTAELDKIADKHADADKGAAAGRYALPAVAAVEMPVAVGRYDSARYSLGNCSRKPAANTNCGATWRIFAEAAHEKRTKTRCA